jgi:hypothetical protein
MTEGVDSLIRDREEAINETDARGEIIYGETVIPLCDQQHPISVEPGANLQLLL